MKSSLLSDNMKSYLNQGANDYLKADDRKSVLTTLQQYVNSIFEDEANTDYSGRYVFTGYRTDTSLLFPENTDKLSYQHILFYRQELLLYHKDKRFHCHLLRMHLYLLMNV